MVAEVLESPTEIFQIDSLTAAVRVAAVAQEADAKRNIVADGPHPFLSPVGSLFQRVA
jgi:hypothetical protein